MAVTPELPCRSDNIICIIILIEVCVCVGPVKRWRDGRGVKGGKVKDQRRSFILFKTVNDGWMKGRKGVME